MNIRSIFFLLAIVTATVAWRSELYPENWQPGVPDSAGRFLHDFSYAGYHRGEKPIPVIEGPRFRVTDAPFLADSTGKSDATLAIQQTIDSVEAHGGGVVYIPAGTYLLSLQAGQEYGLRISGDNVVLRGAGVDRTFLINTATTMRSAELIDIRPAAWGTWFGKESGALFLTRDELLPTSTVQLSDVSSFSVGDSILIRTNVTAEFIAEHGMTEGVIGGWQTSMQGVIFSRRITAINNNSKEITIDVPTRYFLKQRDSARIYYPPKQIQEVGIEDFSIGNLQHPATTGWGDNDYTIEGTGSYEVHGSHLIRFLNAENCWVRRINTFRPVENGSDNHLLSNMLLLSESRFITVDSCDFRKPQYEGGGGNGYLYTLQAQECLITACNAEHGRHNFDFKAMKTSGNVVYNNRAADSRYTSDFHMWLSPSNLFDNMSMDGDNLEAKYRPYGGGVEHGHSTTQSVFWNTQGDAYMSGKEYSVQSQQYGWGYVIGTRGAATGVNVTLASGTYPSTAPMDFVEGEGLGTTLEPHSLYLDQTVRRLGVNTAPTLQLSDELYWTQLPRTTLHLMGSISDDGFPTDSMLRSEWILLDGPDMLSFSDKNAVSTEVVATAAGKYALKLVATDGRAADEKRVTLRILPEPQAAELSVYGVSVSGAQLENDGFNTLDDRLDTRWSVNGDGEWICYDVGDSAKLTGVSLAFHDGDQRKAFFSLAVSLDSINWDTVVVYDSSSGTTTAVEAFSLQADTTLTRYVKLIGHGNCSSLWNSITEVELYGISGTPVFVKSSADMQQLIPLVRIVGKKLVLNLQKPEALEVNLFALNGRRVGTIKKQVLGGLTNLALPANLADGVYVAEIIFNQSVVRHRVILH